MKLNLAPMKPSAQPSVRLTLLAAAAGYLASLFMPAFYWNPASSMVGLEVLLIGHTGIPHGLWAWLANPCLWISWALLLREEAKWSSRMGSLSALLASTTWLMVLVVYYPERTPVAGLRLVSFMPGLWVWIASIALTLLACHLASQKVRTLEVTPKGRPKGLPIWSRATVRDQQNFLESQKVQRKA
jgi:hypothetical protein